MASKSPRPEFMEPPPIKRIASASKALYEAAYNNDVADVVNAIEKSADPNIPDEGGWTPMHSAAGHGNVQVMELLYKHGADVNAANSKGETPLHCASYAGRNDAVRWLLEMGADTTARDENGWTAEHWSLERENHIVQSMFERMKMY